MKNNSSKIIVDGASFTWSGSTGSTNASKIGFDGKWWPNVIWVRSHRTGKEMGFVYAGGPAWDHPGFQYVSVGKDRGFTLDITSA